MVGIIVKYKKKLLSKALSISDSYNYYKDNYENLVKENTALKKKYDKLNKSHEELLDTYERDVYFYDFDTVMKKFYISPVISSPFSFFDKRCFASMDYLAKSIRNHLKNSEFNPLVSVILPVHNYQHNIIDIVNSVLNQSYDSFELIIVDDNSDDGTLNLINSFNDSRIRLISNDAQKGLAYCRNMALNNVNGDYVFYIDMDNLWDCDYLATMVGLFYRLPDADAIYTGQFIYNEGFEKISGAVFGTYNKSLLYNNNFISLSAFGHKKHVKDQLSFDKSLDSLEDYHFLLSIAKFFKMYSAPCLLSKYQYNGSFDKIKGISQTFDVDQIKAVHEKLDNNIFKDFSNDYELNKKVSIIIPSYNLVDDLKECIDAISSFNSDLIDIIVVDNDSKTEVRDLLKKLSDDGTIRYVQNDTNYGFTYAVMQGISISDDDSDILLLNNDAILTKGALEAMQYYSYSLDDCGIAVPREVLYSGDSRINNHVPYANSIFECDVTPSKNHKNISQNPLLFDGDLLKLTFAPFFCTYIKREVFNQTIGLDAELGRHYVSDRLFCLYVTSILNLNIYQVSDAKVYHKSQASTKTLKESKKDYDLIFRKNQWEPELAEQFGFRKYIWQDK